MLSRLRTFLDRRSLQEADDPDEQATFPAEKLRRYMLDLKRSYRESTPLANFLQEDGEPLRIELGGQGRVQEILLRLSAEGIRNLHSIQILDADGRSIDLSESAEINASSSYGNSVDRVRSGQFFDPSGTHLWGVHTMRELRPWVRVSLDSPISGVATLVLHNRRDIYAKRSSRLEVETSPNGTEWADVFKLDGDDAFGRASAAVAEQHGVRILDAGALIEGFATAVARGEFVPARKIYRRLPKDYQHQIRDLVNDVFLTEDELEWASHGARRSFRFWSEHEKASYVKIGLQVVEDRKILSDDVCFGFGSVLGPMRDGVLIPHDDDIDIIIGFPNGQAQGITDAKRQVRARLESEGYVVRGDSFAHWHVLREGFKVDVFAGIYEEYGTIGWYPGTRGALTRDLVFPARNETIFGMDYPIPRSPETYLETIYTKSWRNPDPTWAHDWDRSQYRDLA